MRLDATAQQVINAAIPAGVPFAIAALPGSDTPLLYSIDGSEYDGRLTIYPFGKSASKRGITLFRCKNLPSSHHRASGHLTSLKPQDDTIRAEYLAGVQSVIDSLKQTRGKVVISRTLNCFSQSSPAQVAAEYFQSHPSTFRFIFHTPQTGLWLGATPELIAEMAPDGTVTTLALAGTRPAGSGSRPWDMKNSDEHAFVANHITSTLNRLGLEVVATDKATIPFGQVEHMATIIKARPQTAGRQLSIDELTLQLSPTPAISGYPVNEAIAAITATEKHNRGCYGGEIIVETPTDTHSYLCLRCASVSQADSGWRYTIYAGGGITADSRADDEWNETELKLSSLKSAILPNSVINQNHE